MLPPGSENQYCDFAKIPGARRSLEFTLATGAGTGSKGEVDFKEVHMRLRRFLVCDLPVALVLAILLVTFDANPAEAKDLPSDICSLLGAQQLQKTFGQPFGAASKSSAPPAYLGQAAGTNCGYSSERGAPIDITLIVYVDRSPAEAKQTFEKLSAFYPATSKPSGIGDSAYIDKEHAIHVLKGKVRYYISVSSNAADAVKEKQAKDLAVSVAGQI
jgi:hypothetical protein